MTSLPTNSADTGASEQPTLGEQLVASKSLPQVPSKPCDWCEREDQWTCPECKGTGFVELQDE